MADRTIKPDSGNDLVLQNNGGGTKIEIPNSGDIGITGTIGSGTFNGTIGSSADLSNANFPFATQSEVFGTQTTGTITSGTTALTVASASGISNGDFIVGEGITPGTTVSSGAGTTSLTLSANATEDLSSDPVMFYSATKLLSPGLVGGMLCRAWVNFNGIGTVAIRASANVSSITDNGTGDYTVNFITAMPDANYCFSGVCQRNRSIGGGTFTGIITMPLGSPNYGDAFNTSSIRIQTLFNDGSLLNVDPLTVNVAIFR